MGYMTDFSVEAGPFKTEEDAEFFEFKALKTIGYRFEASVSMGLGNHTVSFELDDCKWYSWDADLKKLSMTFPSITIDVEGVGEEQGDHWRARFRNGEDERVEAIITFPDFEKLV